MANLFITCLKTARDFMGMKLLLVLTVISWIYLIKAEKNRVHRILFVYAPAVVMLVFICPLSYKIYELTRLDPDTYYRILWTIPCGIITVYGMVKLFGDTLKGRIIGAIICALLIALCGDYVYDSPHLYRSENAYAIPQDPINVVDSLRAHDDHQRISVLVPSVLMLYVRQYDANINMPYGREVYDVRKDYTHPVYEVFELPEIIDLDKLLDVTREFQVEYIVFYAGQKTDVTPEEAGLTYIDTQGNYTIYQDPEIAKLIKEWEKYYPG
ncbi:MAG: hypothetical protein K6A38_04785 [Lachnospiraceae bacterium]|nr:hypothetical protein [Lachnospiraceae bacterium]